MASDKDAISKLAYDTAVAWKKYTDFFGEPPHGTERQLAAMFELLPDKTLVKAIGAAMKSSGGK